MLCRVSKAIRILSEIRRFFVKADWCSVIIFGKMDLSLLARTLENIL